MGDDAPRTVTAICRALQEQIEHGLLPAAPAQKVDADVAAQPVEPRGKRRRELILVKTAPRPQKRLLRQIHRVVRVPRHAIAEIVDVFLMFEQQLLKGVRIAALRAADQKFILQDPHLKSRLIPAAMAAMSSIVEIEEIFSL